MTDKKFTDEEIIKALECCAKPYCNNNNCPLHENTINTKDCITKLSENALALINRQRAENESLQEAIGRKEDIVRMLCDQTRAYYDELVSAKAEIEILQHKYELAVAEREANVKGFAEDLKSIKSEAVKEFAERLNRRMGFCDLPNGVVRSHIDHLVKEMTEERAE